VRFQIPQFIEVEDKIFGPLTLKQFLYLAGSAGIVVVLWRALPLFFAILFGLPVIIFGVMLAFYRINNKPLIFTIEAAVHYLLSPKLFVWRKIPKKPKALKPAGGPRVGAERSGEILTVPRLSESRLKTMAWSLDVHSAQETRQRNSEK
jgi:hypothetical protein